MYPNPMTNDPDRVAPDHRVQLPSPTPVRPRRRMAAGVLSLLLGLSCFAASPTWAYKAGTGANDRPSDVKVYANVAAYIADAANRNKYKHVQIGSLVYLVTALNNHGTAEAPLTDSNLPPPVDTDRLFKTVAVGGDANAESTGAIAIGFSSKAGGANAVAIGASSKAESWSANAVVIGASSKTESGNTVAIGASSKTVGYSAVAIGSRAKTRGRGSVALGFDSLARRHATALGDTSLAQGQYSIALGLRSEALRDNSIALGSYSRAHMENSIAIGSGWISGSTISPGAKATGTNSIAIGSGWISGSTIRPGAKATGTNSIAIGRDARATGTNSIALGLGAKASDTDSIAIGNQVDAGKDEVVVGTDGHNYKLPGLGKDVTSGTTKVVTVDSTGRLSTQSTATGTASSRGAALRGAAGLSSEVTAVSRTEAADYEKAPAIGSGPTAPATAEQRRVVVQDTNRDGSVRLRTLDFGDLSGMEQRLAGVDRRVTSLSERLNKATAMSSALSALPNVVPGDNRFFLGVGAGHYSSEQALAIGMSARVQSRVFVNAGVALASGDEVSVRGGVGVVW